MVIEDKKVTEVCKLGQGEKVCRYLGFGQGHWQCLLGTPYQKVIDERVLQGEMKAKGINCAGPRSN